MKGLHFSCLFLVWFFAFMNFPYADASSPPVCIGYDPKNDHWGTVGPSATTNEGYCPPDQAFVALSFVGGNSWAPANRLSVRGSCCPLPSGALVEEHQYHDELCPEDFVVTGARQVDETYQLRCTKINKELFSLSPSRVGWNLGWGESLLTRFFGSLFKKTTKQTTRASIPLGIRYGILRASWRTWEEGGCIGYPWGSLLVGRQGKDCVVTIFRELLRSSDNTAIQIYPSCDALDSIYSGNPKCVIKQQKRTITSEAE